MKTVSIYKFQILFTIFTILFMCGIEIWSMGFSAGQKSPSKGYELCIRGYRYDQKTIYCGGIWYVPQAEKGIIQPTALQLLEHSSTKTDEYTSARHVSCGAPDKLTFWRAPTGEAFVTCSFDPPQYDYIQINTSTPLVSGTTMTIPDGHCEQLIHADGTKAPMQCMDEYIIVP